MLHAQEIWTFIQAAVECSVYLEPRAPGLTYAEISEACARAGYRPGETKDAFDYANLNYPEGADGRYPPDNTTISFMGLFHFREDPDYRNFAALDFVVHEFSELARDVGISSSKMDRTVLVEKGVAKGLLRRDIEVAITVLVIAERLREANGIVALPPGLGDRSLPSAERNSITRLPPTKKPHREQAYAIVKDIVERRVDGRTGHAEPLDAFAEQLGPLGYGHLKMWWTQTVAEMRRADTQSTPLSATILAAAIVEGALTFVVKHGRSQALGVFGSKDFERAPTSWKIDDLVKSAAAGRDSAILDEPTRQRALSLIRARQRIHAGRMVDEFPGGIPDLRPEEARDARATAELIVRRVLDWLERHPAAH